MSAIDGTADRSRLRVPAILRWVGWCGLILVGMAAALGDFLSRAPAGAEGLGPAMAPPSPGFPFGTDDLGRDVLSEVIHAGGVTFNHAAAATILAATFGSLSGFAAARGPRSIGAVARYVAGVLISIPPLLLAILLVGLTAKAMAPFAAGIAASPLAFVRAFDRIRRTDHSAHAEFARITGISRASLLRRDLSYEFRDTLSQSIARAIAAVAIILSTASFLGFGASPPDRDLGLMIGAARPLLFTAWWTVAFPVAVLVMIILFARLAAGLDEGERA